MKRSLGIAAAILLAASPAAQATTIGVTLANASFAFVQSLQAAYEARTDVEIVVVDAAGDGAKQLDQVNQFVADGVDAIIVNPIQPDEGITMTMAAGDLPMVFVNQEPINSMMLPPTQVYVGSNENVSGTLEMKEVCRLMGGKGTIAILVGNVDTTAARMRTQAVHDVLDTPDCSGISVTREGQANWEPDQGEAMVRDWLNAGVSVDAIVANNDAMAMGAIKALKARGIAMDSIIVAGVDATSDALDAMAAGDLDVTIFQNAVGQADTSVDVAIKLINGEPVESQVWVPFELVTPSNMSNYR